MIRFPRVNPFPAEVYRLPWGRRGVPDYVRFVDGIYKRSGSISRPFFELVDSAPVPPWLAIPVAGDPAEPVNDAPNGNPCCYWCGRRLYYRTEAGLEFCATCDPIPPPRPEIKGNFSGEDDIDRGDALTMASVVFFLKPGPGLDW